MNETSMNQLLAMNGEKNLWREELSQVNHLNAGMVFGVELKG